MGFSAVQQPNAAAELLSQLPEQAFTVPGDEATSRVLGYLHANCGHCHNLHGTAWPDTDMDLRLRVSDSRPEQTSAYLTTVGVAMSDPKLRAKRVVPRDVEASGVYYRMSLRGPITQMPPIATEHVDECALEAVQTWIESL